MNYRDKTAKFVVKKNKAGEFYFNLVAENGEVVATSEGYETRQGAYNGINAVRRCAVARKVVDESVQPEPEKKAEDIEVTEPEKVTGEIPTLEDLLKLKRGELDEKAGELGLDGSSYGNKTEVATAIIQTLEEAKA